LKTSPSPALPRELSLFDTTSIIVGIIIGSAIFKASPDIAKNTPNAIGFFAVWAAGGLLTLIGSLCYAELATTYDEPGGDFVYLTRAFGRQAGFLFAWAQLWVVRPGAMGAMGFVFQEYAQQLAPLPERWAVLYAAAPIVLLTAVNAAGVQAGKWTQNVLTSAKVLGLLSVAVAGLVATAAPQAAPASPAGEPNWGLAMVLILFAYGGWNDMAYVSAEVKNPERNLWRSLACGAGAVTAIYLLVNLAFYRVLGFEGIRQSQGIAAKVAGHAMGEFGATFVSLLVCISALGAIHGMIFTGSRIYYALGKDHRLFRPLAQWKGAPVASLAVQALVTLAVMLGFGLSTENGFSRMVNYTVVVFWSFLCLTIISTLVLRWREPDRPRPFRAPALPLLVLVMCAACAYMAYSTANYAQSQGTNEVAWSGACVAVGGILAIVDAILRRRERG
jgi:amino acid transporter